MRFHTQTAGVSLTAQQPLNNIVRTAIEALSAVLGGTQSLHTNSYDEALALPSEEAVRVALRTQQVIAHETGVTNTIDPLGGSYFVEALTDRMEEEAYAEFRKIDDLGGMVEAIKQSYPQREIAEASFRLQEEIERGERVIVGVNRYQQEDERQLEILRIPAELERKQIGRVQAVRARRESDAVEAALAELREAAAADRNLMEPLLDCARAHARRARSSSRSSACSARTPKRPSSRRFRRGAEAVQRSALPFNGLGPPSRCKRQFPPCRGKGTRVTTPHPKRRHSSNSRDFARTSAERIRRVRKRRCGRSARHGTERRLRRGHVDPRAASRPAATPTCTGSASATAPRSRPARSPRLRATPSSSSSTRTDSGVYSNDDTGLGIHVSRLPANHPFSPTSGGEYYLAVSAFNNDPWSDSGEIFPDAFSPSLYPDGVIDASGPGAAEPVTSWTGAPRGSWAPMRST